MRKIKEANELMAVSVRQGVELAAIEAKVLLGYLEWHDYSLMMDDKFHLALHDNQGGENADNDQPYTIRDCIELCQEMNEELLADHLSNKDGDADKLESLQKDELILSGLMLRAANALPARVRVFNVAIIENLRKVVPVEAASWDEARLKAEEMWKNGECVLTTADFAGVNYTCYN